MKYLILVSHGEFSKGLKTTLGMFAKDSIRSIIAFGLQPDESVDHLYKRVTKEIDLLPKNSEFVVLADIVGGSPLTTVCRVLAEHSELQKSLVLGGMNFPMALTALMSKDSLDIADLKNTVVTEGTSAIKQFKTTANNNSSEDDI